MWYSVNIMRILLDTNQSDAEKVKQTLENAGYQVDSQDDGGEYDFLIAAAPKSRKTLKNGNIELDKVSHTLKRNKKTIKMTPLEFRMVELFLEHPGEIVNKEMLATECWIKKPNVSGNTIEVYIKRIRDKLGASFVRTVHGVGYQMDKKVKTP